MTSYNSTARVPFKRGGAVSGTKLKQVKQGAAKTKAGAKKGLKIVSYLNPLTAGFQLGKKFRDKKAKGGKVDKKPIKPKRIILWKGKVKDWPGAQKAKERTGKAKGGKVKPWGSGPKPGTHEFLM